MIAAPSGRNGRTAVRLLLTGSGKPPVCSAENLKQIQTLEASKQSMIEAARDHCPRVRGFRDGGNRILVHVFGKDPMTPSLRSDDGVEQRTGNSIRWINMKFLRQDRR